MHVAIDDTYGQAGNQNSRHVTARRRTHVAVAVPDSQVDWVRREIQDLLKFWNSRLGTAAAEFHFVDVLNRKGPWECLATRADETSRANLEVLSNFAQFYAKYQWRILVQTIDDRTLKDHRIRAFQGKIGRFDLSRRDDLSLLFLLLKVKRALAQEPLTIVADEGRGRPGAKFAPEVFSDWTQSYKGLYASSANEPLLQLADFLAFCINRATHLSYKEPRTELDDWFLSLVSQLRLNSDDLTSARLPRDFRAEDMDRVHDMDRLCKGLTN